MPKIRNYAEEIGEGDNVRTGNDDPDSMVKEEWLTLTEKPV